MGEKMRAGELEAHVRGTRYGQGAWYWVRTYPQASYGVVVRAWVEYGTEAVVIREVSEQDTVPLARYMAMRPHAVFTGPIADPFRRARQRRRSAAGEH